MRGPTIGRGATATVSLATIVTGNLFVVKSTELTKSLLLQKEQYLLSKLISPYVIKYIGYDISYDNNNIPMYNMFMEYAPGGTISDVIKTQGGSLDECLIRSYTRQILLGLDYLHSNNIVHCDIKCANILVCEDRVKIGDLGCAKLVDNGTASSLFSGTPIFMAPEVARGEAQGFAADMWAVGCAVIEMTTGCHPWQELNNPVSALYRIGYSGDVPMFPEWLTEEAKDFLNKCLQRNYEERWNVKQLLQHPFVLNSSGKKSEGFIKCSPSSILYQGFWDSFEEHEVSPEPTRFVGVSGDYPMSRIMQLVESTPCLPNWVDEDDWITVRINHVDVEDNDDDDDDSESNGVDLFLFSDSYVDDYSWSDRMMLESDLDVGNDFSLLDLKNMKDNNCLLIDSDFNFALLGHLFLELANEYMFNCAFVTKKNNITNVFYDLQTLVNNNNDNNNITPTTHSCKKIPIKEATRLKVERSMLLNSCLLGII
ncbi:mitogen-activated protein kinase kinase kinase 18-like [Bidens hawaiensis]|uniref:mitogen-activated protein kinase kinase kinase 18-like n=1 Tax=Bidens hawaiensis TaxID=980011 RepID=UPI00404A6F8E